MNSKKLNVLIFPAGEVNSVELHDALCSCVNIEVFGASSVERHGSYIFKNYTPNIPFINEENFFEKFNKYLNNKKIDVIFPTHDTVASFFASNIEKINAKVIVASKETSDICRDKEKTYKIFNGYDFLPKLFNSIEEFPIFIKPKIGQGAIGTQLIKSKNDLLPNIDLNEYVICEYLPGIEYTVDCLTSKNGELLFVSPRSRQRTMAGISVAGSNEMLTYDIKYIAATINEKLSFNGLWWFQLKQDKNNKWKLLEISTRCAGTMCLTRALGINLPLLSVYIKMGYDVEIINNKYNIKMDRTLISRYKIDYSYNTVYIDFDDTLIFDNKVNLKAIQFLYQCQNLNKKVILITKHNNDIRDTLKKYRIDEKLFCEILRIEPSDTKSKYIQQKKSIFIDNAFNERKDVQKVCGIPVFDVDAIEVLLDWRN